jgi:hypothetical protein
VGPGPGRLRHFVSRGWEELVLMLQSRDGRKGEEPNRAPRVPLDGRLRSSRQYCIALFTVGALHT